MDEQVVSTSTDEGIAPRNVHRLRTVVRGVVVLLVVVLSALAAFFWVHSEEMAVNQFNRTSLVLARLGATRIEETFVRIEKRLQVLARSDCRNPGAATCPLTDNDVLAEMRPMGAVDVIRAEEDGSVVTTMALRPEVVEPVVRSTLARCRGGSFCVGFSEDGTEGGPDERLAVVSVRQDRAQDHAPGSRVAALFRWDLLGRSVTEEVALDPQGLAWIVEEGGKLLYHPSNPDVCNEGTRREDARCHVCHSGTDVPTEVLQGEAGVGAINVAGSIPKLVAVAPLKIAGQRWSLAVAAPYASVVAGNRRVLIVAILISGALIGLFLLVTYFLDRENRRQIGALSENQATIERLNSELETKVRRRTKELARLYNEISDFRRKQEGRDRLAIIGELASVVAHEIRTPLNSLAISSERLARKLKAENQIDPDGTAGMVQSQIYEIHRINDYIEEYLRLARLPRRRVVRSDVGKLVGGLLKFLAVEGERQGVKVNHSPPARPVVAEIDEEQIRQVLLNLVVNAFQAMPGGGDLHVEIESVDDDVVIRLRDTGVGIAKEHLDDVFKPFFTTREGGTGLGLAICARIVKEHRGSLVCESEVGHGTTFTVTLPVVRSTNGAAHGDGAGR